MPMQEPARDEADARFAGAESAELVVLAQIAAGMPADRIEESADRVLADQDDRPTPAATAFYRAYGDVARTYAAAARRFGLDHGAAHLTACQLRHWRPADAAITQPGTGAN